jgi:hypothetical protein
MPDQAAPPSFLACIPHVIEPHWDNVWAPRLAGFPVNIVYAARIKGAGLAQATYVLLNGCWQAKARLHVMRSEKGRGGSISSERSGKALILPAGRGV